MPGLNADDVDQLARQLGRSRCSSTSSSTSTSPSRTCRRRSTPRGTFLPRDLPTPPIYSKINPADAPILTLALTSETLPLSQVRGPRRHAPGAEDLAAPGRRPGDASAAARSRRCASRRTRPRWPAYGLDLEDVRTAIAAANVNQAKGSFDGPRQAYTIGANDQLLSSAELPAARSSPTSNGAPVRLSRRRRRRRRRRERRSQAAWMNDDAGRHPQRPAPAGRQHHRGRRPRQGAAAAAARRRCRRRSRSTILTDRTDDHPRLGART